MNKPVTLKPLTVSKLNTVAQILLALVVLASLAFEFDAWWLIQGLTGAGRGPHARVGRPLSARMGAPHERHQGRAAMNAREALGSLPWTSIMRRASPATISSAGRRTPRR